MLLREIERISVLLIGRAGRLNGPRGSQRRHFRTTFNEHVPFYELDRSDPSLHARASYIQVGRRLIGFAVEDRSCRVTPLIAAILL